MSETPNLGALSAMLASLTGGAQDDTGRRTPIAETEKPGDQSDPDELTT
jgi:hypothetical protein